MGEQRRLAELPALTAAGRGRNQRVEENAADRRQRLEDLLRLGRRRQRTVGVAQRRQRRRGFQQRLGLADAQIGIGLTRRQQLVLQRQRPVEDALDGGGRHANHVAEFLCQIEHQAVGGAGGERQCALGPRPLNHGLAAVDLGEYRERDGDRGNRERAADPEALPRRRRAPARADKSLMQFGRRIGVRRPAVEPAFGGFQILAAQRGTRAAAQLLPVPRQFTEPGMFAHPAEVGAQRAVDLCKRGVPVVGFGAEDPVEARHRRRRVGDGDGAGDDRNEPLAEPRAFVELPAANRRGDPVRADAEHHRIGGGEQSAQALLPGLARRDVVGVEERVEAALRQRVDQHAGKRAVLARIGDEDLGAVAVRRNGARKRSFTHTRRFLRSGDIVLGGGGG